MNIPGQFRIRKVKIRLEAGYSYETFMVEGYLRGQRVRKKFKSRLEAEAELACLNVQAGNSDAALRLLPTRLEPAELAEAEFCIQRLEGRTSLRTAIEWYLENYRPPVAEMEFTAGVSEFLKSRKGRVAPRHLAELRRQLTTFATNFTGRPIHSFRRPEIVAYLESKVEWGPKTWNNVRGILSSFFDYAQNQDRGWSLANPVTGVEQRAVPRGLPIVSTAEKIAELFRFLETYTGSELNPLPPGFFIPYFALATFAGVRPSVPDGEICKLSRIQRIERFIDTDVGVIRITPEVAKTDDLRTIKIRPNLLAWMRAYPLKQFPIGFPNMVDRLTFVKKRFNITHDELRHTFLSMHVAKFKSIGEAALEGGNSEAIIKKHYLNMVGEEEAEKFWSILPQNGCLVDAFPRVA